MTNKYQSADMKRSYIYNDHSSIITIFGIAAVFIPLGASAGTSAKASNTTGILSFF